MNSIQIHQTSKSGRRLEKIYDGPVNSQSNGLGIDVLPTALQQPYFGIGGAMNDATNYNLSIMDHDLREKTLREIFHPTDGMGWNFVRISIGASDFSKVRYSLAETPGDLDLRHFSIAHDLNYNIPTFQRILELNPDVFFFAAPWSPPAWMKDTLTMVGPKGKLKREYYGTFARYLVKFVQAYAKEGIRIGALSVQNEVQAEHLSKPMPQCVYEHFEEADLIVDHLVPALRDAGLDTKIWAMDHNWLMGDYAMRCLEHKNCKDLVDAVAWHCYEGAPENINFFRHRYPKIHHYYTEGNTHTRWIDFAEMEYVALDRIFRNNHESYCTWVTVLDEMGGPGEGPFIVNVEGDNYGMITYNRKTKQAHVHLEHYKIGHIAKFVRRGATRIFSTNHIPNVAFRNPDDSVVIYLNNNAKAGQRVTINVAGHPAHSMELEPHSYYTLVLPAS